jgi:NAD(P)-dependent dehydrogenase (short-subunit alcohol dehydrogenase family)
MDDFKGRTALVTGATRGIGFGIAEELVARGANVCITARKPEELEEAISNLDPDGSGRAIAARGSADDAEHQQSRRRWSGSAGSTSSSTTPRSTRNTAR